MGNESRAPEQFMYMLKPTRLGMLTEGPTDRERDIVSQHFSYLEGLAERGTVLLAGRTQDASVSTLGIVLLRAASLEQAQAVMENDPSVRGGVMSAEVHPFRIAIRGDI